MDAFSKCHPAVNAVFFIGAMCAGVLLQHPAYLLMGILCSGCYYLLLNGKQGLKSILTLLPLFVFVAAINPLLNLQGTHILFRIFRRPYTLEALLYGCAVAAMFVTMVLWFGCYNKVLTSDKLTSLFGNLLPALSLVLVMVFRMIPNFIRKTKQIIGARQAIGKGAAANETTKEKLSDGMVVLGTLTSWALEGSVTTGDSMRARGYGSAKRSSFMIYRMTATDRWLLALMLGLLGCTVTAACFGQTEARFTPDLSFAPVSWGIVPYSIYLLIPTALHIKEALAWHISRSRI